MERKDLPVVELTRSVIDFEEDCIDPITQLVLVEALDYCIETSMSRLDSVGKIFPKVSMSGANSLAAVNAIRESINRTAKCKAPDEPLGRILPPKEPSVPSVPSVPAKAKAKVEEKKKKRAGPPEPWGQAFYVDKTGTKHGPYGSPTELGRELGAKVKGETDMPEQFEKLGCRVTQNGEGRPAKKGEGFIVRWQTGCTLPAIIEKLAEVKKVLPKEERQYATPYVAVKVGGKIVRWEDADGKPLPPELWPNPGRPFSAATALAAKQAVAERRETKGGVGAIIKDVWDNLTVEGRESLAEFRGLESEIGSKTWHELTPSEQVKIQGA